MRSAVIAFLLAAACAAGAVADPRPTVAPRGTATQCLDTLGVPRAPVCRTHQASRIDVEPDICICGAGLREVSAPYCDPGEKPAPDSADADRARLDAAKHGALFSARYQGRRFCTALGRSGGS